MYNRMLYILIPQEIRAACTCTREISNMHLNSNMRDVFAHASIYVYTARDT
jgi:vancomycin permeability regulator SanA